MVRFLAIGMLALGLVCPQAGAKRFGFQGFSGTYKGGYAITVNDVGTGGGSAIVRIRAARDGRSATVTWINTFYYEHGSRRIALRWRFLPGGRFSTNTLDAHRNGLPGSGSFTLTGNRPAAFSASDASGALTAEGRLKRIGGGALAITVTLRGLPEGNVAYAFNGGK